MDWEQGGTIRSNPLREEVCHKMEGGTRRRGSGHAQSECVAAATQEGFIEVFKGECVGIEFGLA